MTIYRQRSGHAEALDCPPCAALALRIWAGTLWTCGQVEMQFQHMSVPPFDDVDGRRALLDRLNAIDGVTIDASRLTKGPSFSIATLAVGDRLDRFLEAIDWAYAEASIAARRG